jgi:hypothetical protein
LIAGVLVFKNLKLLLNFMINWSGYASAGDKELDVSALPTGSYTLLIDYGTKREAVRMIKQ